MWSVFGLLVAVMLLINLGLNRKSHEISFREALTWMIYVFGTILIVTGIKMAFGGDDKIEPEKNPLVRLVRRFVPITKRAQGDRLFISKRGVRAATPLFMALVSRCSWLIPGSRYRCISHSGLSLVCWRFP